MTDAEQSFIASIRSLEDFNSAYIQANKQVLQSRSPIQFQATSSVSSAVSTTALNITPPIIINDYVRMCSMYCVMLWTHWESLGLITTALEEIRLIRNCLVHHEGDMARYSQSSKKKWANQGVQLITLATGKPYVQGYSLVIGDQDLMNFTTLMKTEFTNLTGVSF
jgi:hypothetical protein